MRLHGDIQRQGASDSGRCCPWNCARAASASRTDAEDERRNSRHADIADSLVSASNSLRRLGPDVLATRSAMRREVSDAFTRAWVGLWVTTGPCQHFYRKEFDLAHQRDGRLAQHLEHAKATLMGPMSVESNNNAMPAQAREPATLDDVSRDIAVWLQGMRLTGDRGWYFRVARDLMSLVGNASLLAIISARFYRDATQPETSPLTATGMWPGAAAANTPFGIPWADWTLLSFEGLKGLLTQSLGSPTLIRHHAVDEVLKRMDAGCRLLSACLPDDLPSATGPSPSVWRDALGTLTQLRDVATLFTLTNTAVPPARLILWVSSWLEPDPRGLNSDRGALRVAGLVLDSCRAVTSLAGTWARNVAFSHDANGLQKRWQALGDAASRVPEAELSRVMRRVAHVMKISIHCDTLLLAKIASDDNLCRYLLGAPEPLTVSAIARACESYGVSAHSSGFGNMALLSLQPAENSWGKRWRDESWQWSATTSVRAAYRLLLAYQHWGSMLPEWLMSRTDAAHEIAPTSRPEPAVHIDIGDNPAYDETGC